MNFTIPNGAAAQAVIKEKQAEKEAKKSKKYQYKRLDKSSLFLFVK